MERDTFETIFGTILAVWIIALVYYCLCVAFGIDPWATALTAAPYVGAILLIPLSIYSYRRIRDRIEEQTGPFSPGDHVVYMKEKYSDHPGRRAEQIAPAPLGEGYRYVVRKPWTVARVVNDELIEVVTNGDKHHLIRVDDPNLHKPSLLEAAALRWRWHKRFPEAVAA